MPWLAIAMTGCADQARSATEACGATVVAIAEPHVPPVTVNPLEPETGFPVGAHARRLADLLEAVFGLAGPVAEVIKAGLLRAYADCGWDAVTGTTPPGAHTQLAVPAFTQLRHAALAVARDFGYDAGLRAAVDGFMRAKLEPVWTGPAGPVLQGGHPADIAALLRGNVLLAGDGLAGDQTASFLSGVVMARIAERLHVRGPQRPRFALVVAAADPGPEAAGWFSGLAREMRAHGTEVINAESSRPAQGTAAPGPGRGEAAPFAPVLRGRRSAGAGPGACGTSHAAGTNCTRPACSCTMTTWPGSGSGPRRCCSRSWPACAAARAAEVLSGWRALGPRRREWSWPRSWTARGPLAPRRCGGITIRGA